MTPDSMANEVEEQKLLLKQYLGQYYYAKMKKKQLEARLRTFRENMLGTKGMQYSPVPRSQTNSVGDGPATQVIRAMEIEDRIESQKAEMAKTMLNVMKIMDLINPFSIRSRIILITIFWEVTSSADDGSSAISTFGERMVEIAIPVLCFIPPESSTACFCSTSSGRPKI